MRLPAAVRLGSPAHLGGLAHLGLALRRDLDDVPDQPGAAQAVRASDHDLLDLVTSGYLERMGYEYTPSSAASTFREPAKVLSALA